MINSQEFKTLTVLSTVLTDGEKTFIFLGYNPVEQSVDVVEKEKLDTFKHLEVDDIITLDITSNYWRQRIRIKKEPAPQSFSSQREVWEYLLSGGVVEDGDEEFRFNNTGKLESKEPDEDDDDWVQCDDGFRNFKAYKPQQSKIATRVTGVDGTWVEFIGTKVIATGRE